MSNQQPTGRKATWQKAVLLIYPFLLAYYPVFALRNHNIDYVDLTTILRSLILVTTGTALLTAVTYLLVRNLEKSSVIVSLIAITALSYGHLYLQLENSLGDPIRHRYLLAIEVLILLVLTILILMSTRLASILAQFLAVASVVLLGIVLFESVRNDIGVYRARAAVQNDTPIIQYQGGDKLPDFYLVILDGHTRSDVLKERFGYDNSDFIRQLSEMGFYVSECSQSNYASTKLSLVSAMYGDYIQNMIAEGEVLPPLQDSPLNQTLQSVGYRTIAFENRASGHFDLREDIHLSRNQMALERYDLLGGISEFEKMMVETSILRFAVDTELIPGIDASRLEEWENWEHYYQTQYILSELGKVPEIPGAKFVYTHIMVPHSPYVFAPDGSYLSHKSPIKGYRSNTEFIDTHLPLILKTIIEKSDPPPIIVVMGDHGPPTRRTVSRQMRMATLNAYLVNETAKAQMYPSLTPINAFRIILNAHYGGDYPLVEDVSYYAYKTKQLPEAEIIQNECPIAP